MRGLRVLVPLAIVVAAACGSSPSGAATSGAGGASAVKATLTDNKIVLDKATGAGGTVTFNVANSGTVVHSFLILKTDVAQDKIPADPKDASKVQELGLVKTTGQIPAGQTKDLSAKLDPGNYVLICNEPAHYVVGMHVAFTVK